MSPSAQAAPVQADDWPVAAPRLSTDYLNRFGEALMLIEMAPMDPEVLHDLKGWRPVGYAEHFATSNLRCAAEAGAAYEALDPSGRAAFDGLCRAMGRLIVTATALIDERSESADIALIVDVAVEALRRQMADANRFINANGRLELSTGTGDDLQSTIDALFA